MLDPGGSRPLSRSVSTPYGKRVGQRATGTRLELSAATTTATTPDDAAAASAVVINVNEQAAAPPDEQQQPLITSHPTPLPPVSPKPIPPKRRRFPWLVLAMFILVSYIYSTYMIFVLVPEVRNAQGGWTRPAYAWAGIFNLGMLFFVASYLQSVFTDPGRVPAHWGFYVGEDARRKRYCRVCDVWKPNRTHHCSQCSRCVLHMDHHCPWINNCVGFYNRKYFLLTLVYATLLLLAIFCHTVLHIGRTVGGIVPGLFEWGYSQPVAYYGETSGYELADWACSLSMLVLVACILTALIPFGRFHWFLLRMNLTTIESIDPTSRDHGLYDLGVRRNFEQVCGTSVLFWCLPCSATEASRPVGDGLIWRRHYLKVPQLPFT